MFSKFKDNFITIEGGDGCGKGTISRELSRILGIPRIDFPNYTNYSGKLIKAILNREMPYPDAFVFQSLQTANKIETLHCMETELQYVLDRYKGSSIAYGLCMDVPLKELEVMNSVLPDSKITFLLSGKTYRMNGDVHENDEVQKKVSKIYLNLAKRYDWIVINNEPEIECIVNEILAELECRDIINK